MKPRAEIVARKPDGTLGGIKAHGLSPISQDFVPVRFDGSLTFINVAYFEDIILEAQAEYPEARVLLVVGSGINEIDASGEEKVRELAERLREMGVKLMFSGLKQQVLRVFERGGLVELLGPESFFSDKERALQVLCGLYGASRCVDRTGKWRSTPLPRGLSGRPPPPPATANPPAPDSEASSHPSLTPSFRSVRGIWQRSPPP